MMSMNSSVSSKWQSAYNVDLPTPPIVWEYFQSIPPEDYRYCKHYCAFIDTVNDFLMLRTWVGKKTKTKGLQIREIARRLEGDKARINYIADWLGIGGWVVNWDIDWEYDKWWMLNNYSSGWFYGPILNGDDILKDYPYCQWDEIVAKETPMNFFEYISIYRQHPKVELLAKAGYAPLIKHIKMLNLEAKSLDKILKVKPKWVEYLKGKDVTYLQAVRKHPEYTERGIARYRLIKNTNYLKECLKYSDREQFIDYLYEQQKKIYDPITMRDYYSMAKELGYPLNENRYLMPADIVAAHNRLAVEATVRKSELLTKQIHEHMVKMEKYCFTENGLIIRPCHSQEELETESQVLKHCVRTYGDKVAKGLTAIFFIRKEQETEQPYVTLELKNNTVIQVRGYRNNVEAPLDDNVKAFVSDWCRQYKLTNWIR